MLQALRNAITLPEIRNKIIFTLFILVIYRLISHIPVPGVNPEVLTLIRQAVEQGNAGGLGNLVGLLSLLSGGAVFNFSVLAMGVYPYVTASLILQLLVPIIPRLEEIAKEGDSGRRKINRLTYFLTVPMAALNAIGQVNIFENIGASVAAGQRVIPMWGFDRPEYIMPTIVTIVTMTAGTMFAVWLGELITEQGIGQGLSIIIFGGIVSRIPSNIAQIAAGNTAVLTLLAFVAITVLTVLAIVFIQEGERRIPVQYGKRVRGRRMMGGAGTHIPLKVNTAGMIPLIFAQAMLVFPAIIAGFFVNSTDASVQAFATSVVQLFSAGTTNNNAISFSLVLYTVMYFLLVVGFTYFYTDVMMQQQNLPENLQKQGGFIPGIRPGKSTEVFITKVMRRLTLVGALFLGMLAILPFLLGFVSHIPGFAFLRPVSGNNLLLSGAGLLIVVGVVLDTMRQLEAQLMMRNYEGFIK
jgi:preprotein translocase subunit SecY